MQQAGEQCKNKAGIRGAEGEPPDQDAHIGYAVWIAVPRFVSHPGNPQRVGVIVDVVRSARHGEAIGRRYEHKVVLFQFDIWLSVDGKPRGPLQNEGEERASVTRPVHPPIAGTARRLGEGQARLQQADDFAKGIDQSDDL
jgi:hypothetical protein